MEEIRTDKGPSGSQVAVLLELLKQSILNKEYHDYRGPSSTEGWGGAGVLFCTEKPAAVADSFYPEPRMVVTPHAHAVGWLVNNLGALFSAAGLIDYQSKYRFYAGLADTAEQYQQSLDQHDDAAEGLLMAIHAETSAMLDTYRQFNAQEVKP